VSPWFHETKLCTRHGDSCGRRDLLDLVDFGVKMAAFAALGEMVVALSPPTAPLAAGCSGVNDGESTLNRFLTLMVGATGQPISSNASSLVDNPTYFSF
jgi:hypothetical protein